jgi:hypothetical protein
MPYIPKPNRQYAKDNPHDVGELTYCLTYHIMEWLKAGPHRFARMAMVLGALEATRAEFYRRVVAPYEWDKCNENGDVY